MSTPDRPPAHTLHLWEFQVVRDAMALGGLALAVWLGAELSVVSVPLLVALGLAYICEPLVRRIAAALPRLGRAGAVILLLLTATGLLAIAAMVALPPMARQATALVRNADGYAARARAFLVDEQRPAWLREAATAALARLSPVPDQASASATPATATSLDEARVRAMIHEELERRDSSPSNSGMLGSIAHAGGALLGMLGGLIGKVVGVGMFLAITAFAFFTFAVRFPAVAESLRSLVPSPRRARADQLLNRMDSIISSFVRGRLITAAVLGSIYAIGWTICGVPYALVLGLATGALSLVPYLAVIGLPLAWGLLAMQALGAEGPGFYTTVDPESAKLSLIWWKLLLFPALVNTVAQSLEDYVLNPLIQGKATDMHPVAIMIAIIAGGSLAGLYGMMLAVPAAACARVLASEVIVPRIRAWAERAVGGA